MIKKRVLKKGKYVVTREGSIVINLSKRLCKSLKPLSKKIEIAGSIRRKVKTPVDIDIVLIPKAKQKIMDHLKTKGTYMQGRGKRITFKIQGVKVEIYYTDSKSWGAMLMTYTGPSGYNIGLRSLAKKRGLLLNQYGLFQNGKHIAGKTEKSIYTTLDKKYKSPELR